MATAVIRVLAAALIGTVVGIAVMVIVIAVSTSGNDQSSSIGLSLSQPVATTTPATTPSGGTGGSTGGGGNTALIAQGKTLFSSNGCSGCHTLAAAGSSGSIGPNLDTQLASDAQAAGVPLDQFVKESITDPNKYIAKGYNSGVMPTSFSSMSPQDIDALVALITSGKKQ